MTEEIWFLMERYVFPPKKKNVCPIQFFAECLINMASFHFFVLKDLQAVWNNMKFGTEFQVSNVFNILTQQPIEEKISPDFVIVEFTVNSMYAYHITFLMLYIGVAYQLDPQRLQMANPWTKRLWSKYDLAVVLNQYSYLKSKDMLDISDMSKRMYKIHPMLVDDPALFFQKVYQFPLSAAFENHQYGKALNHVIRQGFVVWNMNAKYFLNDNQVFIAIMQWLGQLYLSLFCPENKLVITQDRSEYLIPESFPYRHPMVIREMVSRIIDLMLRYYDSQGNEQRPIVGLAALVLVYESMKMNQEVGCFDISVQELVRACEMCIDKMQDAKKIENVMRELENREKPKIIIPDKEKIQEMAEKTRDVNEDFKELYEGNKTRWEELAEMQAQKSAEQNQVTRLRELARQRALEKQKREMLAAKRDWQVYKENE